MQIQATLDIQQAEARTLQDRWGTREIAAPLTNERHKPNPGHVLGEGEGQEQAELRSPPLS